MNGIKMDLAQDSPFPSYVNHKIKGCENLGPYQKWSKWRKIRRFAIAQMMCWDGPRSVGSLRKDLAFRIANGLVLLHGKVPVPSL